MTEPSLPAWVQWYIDWLHVISVGCAVTFTFLRALIRWICNVPDALTKKNAMHDVANGLVLPFFIVIVIGSIYREVLVNVESHAFALVGLMGIIYIFSDLADHKSDIANLKRKANNEIDQP